MQVTYFGAISALVKLRRETILLPKEDASVGKLIEVLSKEHGERFEELTKRSEFTSPLVTIFVNGQSVASLADSQKLLLSDQSEVEVSLINQMSGGSQYTQLFIAPLPSNGGC